jgi:hypothetical protein
VNLHKLSGGAAKPSGWLGSIDGVEVTAKDPSDSTSVEEELTSHTQLSQLTEGMTVAVSSLSKAA